MPSGGPPRPPQQLPRRRSAPPAATGGAAQARLARGRGPEPMDIDRPSRSKRGSSARPSPTKAPKKKARSRSMSPAPSRLPKQVSDLRHALRLNVIDGLSWQRAAEGANSASQSVTAGLSAKITKCDVQRYGKKFREEFDEDATLCLARQNLNEALRNNPRDREARAVVVARGILDGLESSKKVELGRSIDKLQLKVAGNPQFNDARVFTDNEEMVMAESINQVSLCGFPFGYEEAQDLIAALAAEFGRPDFVASTEFMRGFQKRTNCIFSALGRSTGRLSRRGPWS